MTQRDTAAAAYGAQLEAAEASEALQVISLMPAATAGVMDQGMDPLVSGGSSRGSGGTTQRTTWQRWVAWGYVLMTLMLTKYRRVLLSLHFAFIACTAVVVLAISATITPVRKHACAVSRLMTHTDNGRTILCRGVRPLRLGHLRRGLHVRLCGHPLPRHHQAARAALALEPAFPLWFWISFNIFVLINWSCVTAVFYLPQRDCVAAGDTTSWWPWYNYCSQVYNVWAWSIWNIIAVFGNCYFIIADELDSTFVESEAIAVKRLRDEAATI